MAMPQDEKLRQQQQRAWDRHSVLQVIIDRHSVGQGATRDIICGVTGITMTRVDSFIKDLKTDQLIRQTKPGAYEPIDQTPDRAIGATILPSGRVKAELDGEVWNMSIREAAKLSALLRGMAQQFGW